MRAEKITTSLIRDVATDQREICNWILSLSHTQTHTKKKKRKFTHAIAILVLFFITACVSAGRGGRLLASSLPHVDVQVHGSGRGRMLPTLRHRPLPGWQPVVWHSADMQGPRRHRPPQRRHMAYAQITLHHLQVQGRSMQHEQTNCVDFFNSFWASNCRFVKRLFQFISTCQHCYY